MRLIYVSFFCLLLSGCMHIKYPEIPEYKLRKTGPFLVSESPNLWRFFESHSSDGPLEVQVLIKNADSKEHLLHIEQASLVANKQRTPADCKDINGSRTSLALKSDEMVRVTCRIDIKATPENQVGNRDSIVVLEIPSDEGVVSTERLFRIEEFQ